jgi:NADP-reducing hydrogenase subunit HndC
MRVRSTVLVSGDQASLAAGAQAIVTGFQQELRAYGLQDEVFVSMLQEVGRQDITPFVVVYPEAVVYGPVKPEQVHRLVEEHLYKGRTVTDLQAPAKELTGRIAWLMARKGTMPAEQRIVLERAGRIDPDNIDDYLVQGGYEALGRALTQMKPEEVLAELDRAGLRGRGGAGFPTGRKLQFVAKAPGQPKYVVCNADESEPGTFKDRLILEGDPHSLLEAMAITGYAIGASEGYVYIRGEYRLAYARLEKAIAQAREVGLLGANIFGTAFSFDIHVHAGAGAYICGEETALLESLEGKRGEPRARPPYPVTHGLWNKPTSVNNVETLANIPPIIRYGSAWFRTYGTVKSPGTKVYTILGNVNATGLIEVPMGITLREVIAIYGKGMKKDSTLKLAQTGGSSGSIIPASLQDTPMDYESFANAGVSLGSGALLICDQDTCVVDLARVLVNFFQHESCGKCTPCRVGTPHVYRILTRIAEGTGKMSDLDQLRSLAQGLDQISNCGLGQTVATPIRDVLKHFHAEVEAHIKLKICPAGVCSMSGRQGAAAY